MLECQQLLADDETPFEQPIAEMKTVMFQMMQPALLHPNAASNPLRHLERNFENAYAELSTHCGVAAPAGLTLYAFFHRLDYFEKQRPAN
jgi:hypothetical protein